MERRRLLRETQRQRRILKRRERVREDLVAAKRIRVGVQVSVAAAFSGKVSSAAAVRLVDEAMAVDEGSNDEGSAVGDGGNGGEARNNVDPEAERRVQEAVELAKKMAVRQTALRFLPPMA